MSQRQDDGATMREHLEAIERNGGKRPDELDGPPMPSAVEYLWEWYIQLSDTRQSGFGANPITYVEILSFCFLYGHDIEPWEVGALRAVDRAFIEFVSDRQKEREAAASRKKR